MPNSANVGSAKDFMPKRLSLTLLRKAAHNCQGCHLYKNAKQTVFGEGTKNAKIIMVGEIPGEKEDEIGRPFVGPAGKLLRQAIEEIDLDWEDIYFTNIVKHFKFILQNNRKLHRSPIGSEIKACLPWLQAEIKVIKPKMIVCLGATAAKSVIDKNFRLKEQRGKWLTYSENCDAMVTYHPSAILRAPSDEERHAMKKTFLKDLKKLAGMTR
jgi:uracil-DNA glycosylase family protein